MIPNFIRKNRLFGKALYLADRERSMYLTKLIEPNLNKNDTIIDVGSGACCLNEILAEHGYKATPLDVKNLSLVKNIKPIIYDGKKMPFGANEFDVALLITMLHHTKYPEKIIKEAKRVAGRIIIIEDIYTGNAHKKLTWFLDSLFNFEFAGHPHTNKTDKEWQDTFKRMGLKLTDVAYVNGPLGIRHAAYMLVKG
ncbi:MAG: class I SAM-dependent methyltransferase [Candidatus Aenigmatarchaeota archaeon]